MYRPAPNMLAFSRMFDHSRTANKLQFVRTLHYFNIRCCVSVRFLLFTQVSAADHDCHDSHVSVLVSVNGVSEKVKLSLHLYVAFSDTGTWPLLAVTCCTVSETSSSLPVRAKHAVISLPCI